MDATKKVVFPGFDRVYSIGDSGLRFYFGNIENCETPRSLLRGELSLDIPLKIRHKSGRATPSDVIWTSDASPLILHDRVIEVLSKNHFTGWDTYPVEVYDKTGKIVPGYAGLIITGRCGLVDYTKSEVLIKDFHGKKRKVIKGRFFAQENWDGSDLFMFSDKTGHKLMLEPVVKVLKSAKVKGLCFESIVEDEYWTIKRADLELMPPNIRKNFEDGLLILP